MRHRNYRYTRYRAGLTELFDHRDDPDEWLNRASDPAYARVAENLSRRLPTHFKAPTRGNSAVRWLRNTSTNYEDWLKAAVSADPCAP